MRKFALKPSGAIPQFGLGTWQSKTGGEVKNAVAAAIDLGYRHLDCAFVYLNEEEVGEALNASIASNKVTREEFFVTSKLWNTFHRTDLVAKAVQLSLDQLGLDYLDLYLIHWPMGYLEDGETFPKVGILLPLIARLSPPGLWFVLYLGQGRQVYLLGRGLFGQLQSHGRSCGCRESSGHWNLQFQQQTAAENSR